MRGSNASRRIIDCHSVAHHGTAHHGIASGGDSLALTGSCAVRRGSINHHDGTCARGCCPAALIVVSLGTARHCTARGSALLSAASCIAERVQAAAHLHRITGRGFGVACDLVLRFAAGAGSSARCTHSAASACHLAPCSGSLWRRRWLAGCR